MKALITSTCLVNYRDDRGGVAEQAATVVDGPAETIRALVGSGRALYVNRADDPAKGQQTADKALLDAAAKLLAEADKPTEKRRA